MTTHSYFGRPLLVGALVALATGVAYAPDARAAGVVLDAHQTLAPTAEHSLAASIAKARALHPAVFQKIARLPELAARLERHRRGRALALSPYLKSLGPDALFPMLEMLAVDAPARGSLKGDTWRDLRVGLIEAVGMLRDARAEPVLRATLEQNSEPAIVRAAAVALGRLGDDASALAPGEARDNIGPETSGGHLGARRVPPAGRRADPGGPLAQSPHPAHASWSSSASSATSATPGRGRRRPSQRAARATQCVALAARALVQAFVANSGALRTKAATELLLVAHPSTPGLIAAARQSASPALQQALDHLAQRFAHNPVR